jgi:cutinase
MKFIVTVAALVLAAGVAAVPLTVDKRQGRSTSNELTQGSCKQVIFIWARGSTEGGNMASLIPAISLFTFHPDC